MILGLDVDGVISNFTEALINEAKEMGLGDRFPKSWEDVTDWHFSNDFEAVWKVIERNETFWLSIPAHEEVKEDLDFVPFCYVTARPIASNTTRFWIRQNGFPDAPVHTVAPNTSKLDILKDLGVTHFVDDKPETVEELNANGIVCYLYNRPSNKNYVTNFPRINSLKEINVIS